MNENITKYAGKRHEIVEVIKPVPNTDRTIKFEEVRRAPGVRAIIVRNEKIAFNREYRYNSENYDFRLPGGKVFDFLDEFKRHEHEDMLPYAVRTVIKECKEEIGLIVKDPKLFYKSVLGGSILWDLYYFEITDFEVGTAELEENEIVDGFVWKSFNDIKEMARKGEIQEDRSLGVLFKYMLLKDAI